MTLSDIMINDDVIIRLAKWHENEAVRMVKHPDNLAEMCGLAEIHGETASALYMLLADRDAATMDADMQAREAENMEFNARALMAERDRLRQTLILAAVPLEAMILGGTDKLHSEEMQESIQCAVDAIRTAIRGMAHE